MQQRNGHRHDDVKRARFITGASMLGGFLLLGLGMGLFTGTPGFSITIAVGAWLTAVSLIRTVRDLQRGSSTNQLRGSTVEER